MARRFIASGVMMLALAGCGGSGSGSMGSLGSLGSLNPFAGPRTPAAADTGEVISQRPLVDPGDRVIVTDAREPIDRIASVRLERTPDGAILTARGIAAGQGAFNAELVPVAVDGRTLRYEFRVEEPRTFIGIGPERSREIVLATTLTRAELASLSRIEVAGARNVLTLRP